MMTATEIRARVRAQPFVPFRIVTSSGRTYDVAHPDLILVGVRELMIGRPARRDPILFEGVDRVAVLHVSALEDLPTDGPSSTKGPAPNKPAGN